MLVVRLIQRLEKHDLDPWVHAISPTCYDNNLWWLNVDISANQNKDPLNLRALSFFFIFYHLNHYWRVRKPIFSWHVFSSLYNQFLHWKMFTLEPTNNGSQEKVYSANKGKGRKEGRCTFRNKLKLAYYFFVWSSPKPEKSWAYSAIWSIWYLTWPITGCCLITCPMTSSKRWLVRNKCVAG